MGQTLGKLFFRWYPNARKETETEEGEWVRTALSISLTTHILLFFTSFAIVGFISMLANLILCCICYSAFLTMRERSLVFYLFVLLIAFTEGTVSLFTSKLGNLQFLGKMINLCVYCLLAYMQGKAYYDFKKSGGLHGTALQEQLIEDKAAAIAQQKFEALKASGENKINRAIDDDEARERDAERAARQ